MGVLDDIYNRLSSTLGGAAFPKVAPGPAPEVAAAGTPAGAPPVEESPGAKRFRENKEAEDAAQQEWDSKILSQLDPDIAESFRQDYAAARRSGDPIAQVNVMKSSTAALSAMKKAAAKEPRHPEFKLDQLTPRARRLYEAGASAATVDQAMQEDTKPDTSGGGGYKIPREGLGQEFTYMTDQDVSDLMKEQYKSAHQPESDVWPRLKGTSLKIMNDATFKRSGLKTGDTVCIKIP